MNAEQLLTHFDRIADAHDAIPRLRRFILDLAVRGRLVRQDPNDEPASELLKRIAEEKAERIKGQKSSSDFDADELGEIPRNWCAVPLIALGQWAIGSGFPKNEQGRSEGPYFFLKVSDMNLPENDKYITTANNFINGDAAKRMKAAIHPAGTIIFPKIGGAIATNKRRILTCGSAIDNNCLGIVFSSYINIEWAYLLMTHLDFTQYQAGTAVPALQQRTLATIPVGLPPLAEQHRIVAKVDELMALCDQLEDTRPKREATRDRMATVSLARLNAPNPDPVTFQNHAAFALDNLTPLTTRPDQIKAVRQTILNLAVRGKLVPQDPNDEPTSELLKRIAKDFSRQVAEGKLNKPKPVKPLSAKEGLFPLPRGWAVARFNQVAAIQSNLVDPKRYTALPHIAPDNIESWTARLLSYVSVAEAGVYSGKHLFAAGAILYSKIRPNLAKVAKVDFDGLCSADMYPIHTLIDRDFLVKFMITKDFVAQAVKEENRVAMPKINQSALSDIVVVVPPLAEQHRIVVKVDDLMALCDQLETSLTTGEKTLGRLVESTLHQALEPEENGGVDQLTIRNQF